MAATLGFGVLGAGQISRLACREIHQHPRARVLAAADPSAERLAELSTSLRGAAPSNDPELALTCYADSAALVRDPRLDAVFIATPNAYHAPLALAALEAGKHVIIDKPFALSLSEAEAVVARAERHGKLLTLGMNHRFRADSQRVARAVREGTLGRVYRSEAFWLRRSGIPRLGSWFGSRALAGGGALLDVGAHLLDLALFVLGRFDPKSVSGQVCSTFGARGLGEGGWGLSERSHPEFEVEDSATALLRFADGATLSLDVSWALHQAEPERLNLLLHGSDAGAGCYPAELYRFGAEPGGYQVLPLQSGPLDYPHQSRFHNFIGAILGTEPLCVRPEQALAVQRVLDAIYESSRVGREVMLSQP